MLITTLKTITKSISEFEKVGVDLLWKMGEMSNVRLKYFYMKMSNQFYIIGSSFRQKKKGDAN